ncbi:MULTISPECIES: transposase [Acinetobacter]|uniref:transposase n=1 Tax=Acinetobacter TaxID=469 RepID=UPI00396A7BFA
MISHFRKKVLAKLKDDYPIRAVTQKCEIDKNTIIEYKKWIKIKRTRPSKSSQVDDDLLPTNVEKYPNDFQYERAIRFSCGKSTIGGYPQTTKKSQLKKDLIPPESKNRTKRTILRRFRSIKVPTPNHIS